MSKEICLPNIGGDEVEVTEILVAVGDQIKAEQPLLTVEGDKASMEIPAPQSGVISGIKVKVGDKVSTGSPIFTFSEGTGEATVPAPAAPAAPAASSAQSIEESESAGPDAPVTKVPAAASPALQPAQLPRAQQDSPHQVSDPSTAIYQDAHASPAVRRMARQFGIDLAKVQATGPKGRILKENLHSYVKGALTSAPAAGTQSGLALIPWPKVDFSQFGPIEEVSLSKVQRASGANLHRNWVMIPHVTQMERADITDLENFRKEQNITAEKQKLEVKFTPLVFIMKAVAKALEQWPRFNSSLSPDDQRLILKKYINLGVAVDTPTGLLVPVIRNVNQKGVLELSRELATISQKARGGKLTQAEMQGGTFTISSLGGIGGCAFTPIINAPEVAILGVSRSDISPQWNGKEFLPRLMLPLSLSYDHRVIDGAEGARFINYLGQLLADIRRLLI